MKDDDGKPGLQIIASGERRNGERRVPESVIAQRLGLPPLGLRVQIAMRSAKLKKRGELVQRGGEYQLNKEQILHLCWFVNTPKALAVREELRQRDPVFRLAPEVRLHPSLSETDDQLMVDSREVARVYFDGNHHVLMRELLERIWDKPPERECWFRFCSDGSIDLTSYGLLNALSHWGFDYENKRLDEFQHAWVKLVADIGQKIEAKTGVNPIHQKMQELFGPLRCFRDVGGEMRECCQDCTEPLPAGPILHDELWASIAKPGAFLCFDCIEKRLGRRLTQDDLQVCAFNAGWIPFVGPEAAMQLARGRRLLPGGPKP